MEKLRAEGGAADIEDATVVGGLRSPFFPPGFSYLREVENHQS